MFQGEMEGLKAILSTKTIKVPKPIAIGHTHKDDNNNCSTKNCQHFIVMEYLNMTILKSKLFAEFGKQLANMHMHNLRGNNS